jgi:hypothetical protein
MSTEQNKALLRRCFDEILNKRNFQLLDEFIAPGWVKGWVNDNVPRMASINQIFGSSTASLTCSLRLRKISPRETRSALAVT